ncbi:MAG: hypothetical protein JWR72_3206 [Flavisolibacter sp.]|jgi:hypothetical protein|nr:hypothetical protein [Flavisolibacter sp.]
MSYKKIKKSSWFITTKEYNSTPSIIQQNVAAGVFKT